MHKKCQSLKSVADEHYTEEMVGEGGGGGQRDRDRQPARGRERERAAVGIQIFTAAFVLNHLSV